MHRRRDPFTGNWRFRPKDSALPIPAPREWTQHIEAASDSIWVSEQILHSSGLSSQIAVHGQFDGRYFPVNGSPLVDEIAYQRPGEHEISAIAKKAGRIAMTESAIVSKDAQTLILEISFVSANGQATPARAVFERSPE